MDKRVSAPHGGKDLDLKALDDELGGYGLVMDDEVVIAVEGSPVTKAQLTSALKRLDAAWPQVQYDREHAAVEAARLARYQAETDGLYFDAIRGDGNLDAWNAATAQIRADLPYPEAP
jgi:hypothetical protein